MGHSQAEKARNRERILEAAAEQLRKAGLAGVSIADLMKAANLTHGGFYGHFESRDALIAAALDKALQDGERAAARASSRNGKRTMKSMVNSYLSRPHRDNPGTGCAVSALAGEIARAGRAPREIMSRQLDTYFENIRQAMGPSASRDNAIAIMCTMVGAVTLSRVMTDPALADRVLQASRRMVLDLANPAMTEKAG